MTQNPAPLMPSRNAKPFARRSIEQLQESKIREVANAAMGRRDILAFWFGEPDEVTPAFVREAAVQALAEGDTFYRQNLGIPALREAIARYVSRLRRPVDASNIAVTSSGVNALMLVYQALFDPGDRVVIVTPVWPNVTEGPKILGVDVVRAPLQFDGEWRLDLNQFLERLSPNTRAVIINSPNNPTGWTLERASQAIVLEHCRKRGIWIIADDVYERLYYDAASQPAAPGFLDIADEQDLLVSTNSFSKSWLMTGWRLGWIVAPKLLIGEFAKLIEYNTSCAPGFVQQAGIAALTHGEKVVAHTQARFRTARDFLHDRLNAIAGVTAAKPSGAMYTFFRTENAPDSMRLAKHLVQEVCLGLAPGVAFGPEGEGWLRWCFASSLERLETGVERLQRGLERFHR